MPRFRYIAPAGSPVGFKDLIADLQMQLRGQDAIAALTQAIADRYQVRHCLPVSSGRAAMAILFQLLRELRGDAGRTEIVMPAYTCYSVPAAASVAGLTPRIVDIDPSTLSYNRELLEAVDYSKVLAIVSANLYGYPNELSEIERLARNKDVYLIDDAAQALHATSGGRAVGTFGDVGLYSFDKGKNITSLQGGVVVTQRDDIAARLQERLAALPVPGHADQLRFYIALAAYITLLRPWLYWIPANLPFLGLGRTPYTTDIPMHAYTQAAAGIADRLFMRIDEITSQRREHARQILERLRAVSAITPIAPLQDAEPVYLRLPMLARDGETREQMLGRLTAAGIGATASYPQSIGCLPEVLRFAQVQNNHLQGAMTIAERILTLPTQHYLTGNDIERLVHVLMEDTL